jgi:hypothetical protein
VKKKRIISCKDYPYENRKVNRKVMARDKRIDRSIKTNLKL